MSALRSVVGVLFPCAARALREKEREEREERDARKEREEREKEKEREREKESKNPAQKANKGEGGGEGVRVGGAQGGTQWVGGWEGGALDIAGVLTSYACRPRLLVCGDEGCGQNHMARALLHDLETFPHFSISHPDLFASPGGGGFTPEESLVNILCEARKASPAVVYLPHVELWWDTSSLLLRSTLITLLRDVGAGGGGGGAPLFVLATANVPAHSLPRDVLDLVCGNVLSMPNPKHAEEGGEEVIEVATNTITIKTDTTTIEATITIEVAMTTIEEEATTIIAQRSGEQPPNCARLRQRRRSGDDHDALGGRRTTTDRRTSCRRRLRRRRRELPVVVVVVGR